MILQVEKGMSNYKPNTVDVHLVLLFTGEDDVFTEADLATLETFIAQRMDITAIKTPEGSKITLNGTLPRPQVDGFGVPINWHKPYKAWETATQAQFLDEVQKWLIWKQG